MLKEDEGTGEAGGGGEVQGRGTTVTGHGSGSGKVCVGRNAGGGEEEKGKEPGRLSFSSMYKEEEGTGKTGALGKGGASSETTICHLSCHWSRFW